MDVVSFFDSNRDDMRVLRNRKAVSRKQYNESLKRVEKNSNGWILNTMLTDGNNTQFRKRYRRQLNMTLLFIILAVAALIWTVVELVIIRGSVQLPLICCAACILSLPAYALGCHQTVEAYLMDLINAYIPEDVTAPLIYEGVTDFGKDLYKIYYSEDNSRRCVILKNQEGFKLLVQNWGLRPGAGDDEKIGEGSEDQTEQNPENIIAKIPYYEWLDSGEDSRIFPTARKAEKAAEKICA